MPNILPFKGLRYNLEEKDLTLLVCPPYDVITPEEKYQLENRSDYNAVRLELPGVEEDDYTRANDLFLGWINKGVISQDQKPCLYLTKHEFPVSNKIISRLAIYAVLELESLNSGIVLPHEETRSGPKIDRLKLMESTKVNLSPIMMLYRDQEYEVSNIINNIAQTTETIMAEISSQEKVYMWVIEDENIIQQITKGIGKLPLLIADGHHRYETALTYRDQHIDENENGNKFIMVNCIDIQDPGLCLLPYHRGLQSLTDEDINTLEKSLTKYFEEIPLPQSFIEENDPYQFERLVSEYDFPSMVYINRVNNNIKLFKVSQNIDLANVETNLDPNLFVRCEGWVLYEGVFKSCFPNHIEQKVVYFHDITEAWENDKIQVLFLVKPFPLDLFEEIVDLGLKLPPKSTYFHPKVPTGFVYNSLSLNI